MSAVELFVSAVELFVSAVELFVSAVELFASAVELFASAVELFSVNCTVQLTEKTEKIQPSADAMYVRVAVHPYLQSDTRGGLSSGGA